MDYSKFDMLTPENILQDVLINVGDTEGKKLFHGWYMSQIHQALQDLSFDTLFFEKRLDVPVPTQTLRYDLPQGTFNVKEVYAYNGAICEQGGMIKVWHKRNYFVNDGGRVVAKNRRDNMPDPFYINGRTFNRYPYGDLVITDSARANGNLHFYNVENGTLMISSSLRGFEMLHIRLSGITANLGDVPFIPPVFKEAVVDYVSEAACRALMAEDPQRYTNLWKIYTTRLDKNGFNGSWHKVSNRIAKMSDGEKNDYREYMGRWDY